VRGDRGDSDRATGSRRAKVRGRTRSRAEGRRGLAATGRDRSGQGVDLGRGGTHGGRGRRRRGTESGGGHRLK
jgi:hypothetical protein